LAKRTAVGLNEIRKLINIETKLCEVTGNGSVSNSGSLSPLSSLAQGTDYTNRIGDSIKLQHIRFAYRVNFNTSATSTFFRVIIFRDLDGYGTWPLVTGLLQSASELANRNFLNRERFSILYDDCFPLNSVNPSHTDVIDMPHEGHCKYLNTDTSESSFGKGSVYVVFISNEATNTPAVTWRSSINFTDD